MRSEMDEMITGGGRARTRLGAEPEQAPLRRSSAVQRHALDHLRGMVYTHVVREGDRLLERRQGMRRELRRLPLEVR
jgi:hypothetical protein